MINECAPAASGSPWATAAIVATALGAFVFVALYARLARGVWHRSAVGRNVMALMFVILVVTSLAVLNALHGADWWQRETIRAVCWSAVAVCIWWRVGLLYRLQHHHPEIVRPPAHEESQ